jgi:hypothetical protein
MAGKIEGGLMEAFLPTAKHSKFFVLLRALREFQHRECRPGQETRGKEGPAKPSYHPRSRALYLPSSAKSPPSLDKAGMAKALVGLMHLLLCMSAPLLPD